MKDKKTNNLIIYQFKGGEIEFRGPNNKTKKSQNFAFRSLAESGDKIMNYYEILYIRKVFRIIYA